MPVLRKNKCLEEPAGDPRDAVRKATCLGKETRQLLEIMLELYDRSEYQRCLPPMPRVGHHLYCLVKSTNKVKFTNYLKLIGYKPKKRHIIRLALDMRKISKYEP